METPATHIHARKKVAHTSKGKSGISTLLHHGSEGVTLIICRWWVYYNILPME